MNITSSTGLSIGVVVLILGGMAWLIGGQSSNGRAIESMKNELSMQALTTKTELLSKVEKLETRMQSYENSKNSWTSTAMFRWAVHLQQANPQIKVPEPETETK